MIPRYLIALVLTISAYGIYGGLVAPLLEGSSTIVKPESDLVVNTRDSDQIKQGLIGYLPKDGWEWGPCTILETPQATILFQDHTVMDDGTVELKPLSMIVQAVDRNVEGKPVATPPIILRSPVARLKFERGLSAAGDMGDLQQAQLQGGVQLFRPASSAEKDDGIFLETENVQISPERILTLYDCKFRFGQSYGHGRHLTVDLFGPHSRNGPAGKAFSGIERIELAKVYELYLHRQADPAGTAATGHDDLLGNTSGSYVVTSAGPMKFDFDDRSVSFEDDVRVRPADGQGDQLVCQKLRVILADADPAPPGGSRQLQVQRIVAEGTAANPASILSESRQAEVVAQGIDFDLIENSVTLTSDETVSLTRNQQRIRAREIRYSFTQDGRMGTADMLGPGSITQQANENGKGAITCYWQKQLRLRDDQGKKVLSLGRGRIQLDETEVAADQMHFWIWEVPEPHAEGQPTRWRFEPARFVGIGQVTLVSPKLAGHCQEAAAYWPQPTSANVGKMKRGPARRNFQYVVARRPRVPAVTPTLSPPATQDPDPVTPSSQGHTQPSGQSGASPQGLSWQLPLQAPPPAAGALPMVAPTVATADAAASGGATQATTHFTGNQVQLQMLAGERRSEVAEMTVDGNVVIQQQQTEASGTTRTALEIRGEQLRVLSQPEQRYRLFISGVATQPATVSLEELRLQGQQIHLDQAANRLWIEGPGQMQMAAADPSDSQVPSLRDGSAVDQPALISAGNSTVTWKGGMVFDGQQIYFETDVQSSSRQTSVTDASVTTTSTRSAALSILLNQRIDFMQVQADQPPADLDPRRVIMVGRMDAGEVAFHDYWQPGEDAYAWIATGKNDRHGTFTSSQEIFAPRVTYDAQSSGVFCTGPGTVMARQLAKGPSSNPTPTQFATAGPRTGNIDFIKVDYDDAFQGNLESRQLQFQGNVHTFYTTTIGWNTIPGERVIQQAGSRGMILDCNQLVLAQWTPQASGPTMEMIASGNARVAGSQFNATAERISYYQANGQVVMEAPNRSNAEIWFNNPGTSNKGHMVAKTITYNLDSGECQVQQMQQMEYSQQGPLRKK